MLKLSSNPLAAFSGLYGQDRKIIAPQSLFTTTTTTTSSSSSSTTTTTTVRVSNTLPQTNIAPETPGLEDEFPFEKAREGTLP